MRITANSLDELEQKSLKLFEKGYELKKTPYVTFWTNKYAAKFSDKPNPNSSYLKLKKTIENAQKKIDLVYKDLIKSNKEVKKDGRTR